MATQWTADQWAAISSRNQSLLVAAAAGSGKTAVLKERIIERLLDKDHPLSVQKLLVTTFTKAAAGEMSSRIGSALADKVDSLSALLEGGRLDPKEKEEIQAQRAYLERQLQLLPSAQISTLHSFCQWVIKSYFYHADINPTARIGNDSEMALMRTEVLHDLLVEAYEAVGTDPGQDSYHIYALADMFSDDKSDANLERIILNIYTFAMALANPEKWLRQSLAAYEEVVHKPLLESQWGSYFWQDLGQSLEQCQAYIEAFQNLVEQPEGTACYSAHLDALKANFAPFWAAYQAGSWQDFHRALATYDGKGYKQFRANKETAQVAPELLAQAKTYHEEVKNFLKGLGQSVFMVGEDAWKSQVEEQLPIIEGLVELTLAFKEAYDKAKHEAGVMDFNDLEHLCLKLLVKAGTEDQETPEPSDVALELQGHFEEIMVDEYQDTSGVQEAIINLISTERNRFYVGDVKQSIYSFRMADSDLFMSKYESFVTADDDQQESLAGDAGDDKQELLVGNEGADLVENKSASMTVETVPERRIDLAMNFRSHSNVLAVTNFIFYQIMSKAGAELDYGEKEALVPGRKVGEVPDNWVGGTADLLLVDTASLPEEAGEASADAEGEEEDRPEAQDLELAMIIDEIKKLMAEKVVHNEAYNPETDDASKQFRPLQFRDIVILRRSLAGFGNRMVEAMRNAGIPAYVEERSGYFESMEIQLLLALLQVIDNPEQDLPMAAVLHSPMVGLDANAIGRIRLLGSGSLWSLLPLYAERYEGASSTQEALTGQASGQVTGDQETSAGVFEHRQAPGPVTLFISRMDRWRTLSRRQGVADLLWDIFQELDYVNYVSAMPNGLVRRANVLALLSRAQEFENGSFKGLFRFLRFVESLRDSEQDMAVAKVVSEADNVVRIMTIHKSKGLEFPVVFLSGMQKKFNTMDLRSSVLLHKTGGLGVKGYYPEYRVMYPSLASLYNQELKLNALKAEEERILYVALTRARDKLIMTGSIDNRPDSKGDTKLKKMAKAFVEPALAETGRQLPKDLIRKANSYLDWVFMAFARHLEGGNVLRNALGDERADMAGHDILNQAIPDRAVAEIYVDIKDGSQYPSLDRRSHSSDETVDRVKAMESFHGASLPEDVLERFAFAYQAPQATVTPAKISVSEIKRRFQEREEEAQGLLAYEASDDLLDVYQEEVSDEMGTLLDIDALVDSDLLETGSQQGPVEGDLFQSDESEALVLDLDAEAATRQKAVANSVFGRKPAFLEEEEETLSGARWGTLMHEAMQWLPIEDYRKESLLQALDNLVVTGRMRQEEVKQLNTYALLRFFQSDLAKRMKSASRLEKELPFSMLYDGTQVYPNLEEGEELFLQGIIDTAFLEEGQWVLVDYKTDRVDEAEELIGRYRVQLDLYGQALEQLTGIPLKETYIYSFRLHQAIKL